VRVDVVVATPDSKQPTLVVEVHDTGIGIEPDKIDLIFEAFTQVDSTMTREYGGAGLGLTITKQIVEALGGKIRVESEFGQGSTFIVVLPLLEADMSTAKDSENPPAAAKARRWRALVVDDIESNRKVAQYQLESLGCAVDAVDGGRAAILRLEDQSYDVVFMDCQLPDLDGYETTMEIRKRGLARGTPVIAMTAHAMANDREKCLQAGMDDYIAKPIGPEAMNEMLTNWLDREAIPRGS